MRFGFIVISALFYSIADGSSESNRYVSQEKKSLQTSIAAGKEIYQEFCMTCHLWTNRTHKSEWNKLQQHHASDGFD
jgi:cytochrome c5